MRPVRTQPGCMPQDTLIESGFPLLLKPHEDEGCSLLLSATIDFSFAPLRASFSNFQFHLVGALIHPLP